MPGSQSQNDGTHDNVQKTQFVGDKEATKQLLSFANTSDTSEATNMALNKPLATSNPLAKENEEFLNLVIGKVDGGEIILHTPQSLLNQSVYTKLTESEQDQIDIYAVNMLSTIRRIKDLCTVDEKYTYQMQNLIEEFRLRKEDTEKTFGDVFII